MQFRSQPVAVNSVTLYHYEVPSLWWKQSKMCSKVMQDSDEWPFPYSLSVFPWVGCNSFFSGVRIRFGLSFHGKDTTIIICSFHHWMSGQPSDTGNFTNSLINKMNKDVLLQTTLNRLDYILYFARVFFNQELDKNHRQRFKCESNVSN